jgi:hypothetical protein
MGATPNLEVAAPVPAPPQGLATSQATDTTPLTTMLHLAAAFRAVAGRRPRINPLTTRWTRQAGLDMPAIKSKGEKCDKQIGEYLRIKDLGGNQADHADKPNVPTPTRISAVILRHWMEGLADVAGVSRYPCRGKLRRWDFNFLGSVKPEGLHCLTHNSNTRILVFAPMGNQHPATLPPAARPPATARPAPI